MKLQKYFCDNDIKLGEIVWGGMQIWHTRASGGASGGIGNLAKEDIVFI